TELPRASKIVSSAEVPCSDTRSRRSRIGNSSPLNGRPDSPSIGVDPIGPYRPGRQWMTTCLTDPFVPSQPASEGKIVFTYSIAPTPGIPTGDVSVRNAYGACCKTPVIRFGCPGGGGSG